MMYEKCSIRNYIYRIHSSLFARVFDRRTFDLIIGSSTGNGRRSSASIHNLSRQRRSLSKCNKISPETDSCECCLLCANTSVPNTRRNNYRRVPAHHLPSVDRSPPSAEKREMPSK